MPYSLVAQIGSQCFGSTFAISSMEQELCLYIQETKRFTEISGLTEVKNKARKLPGLQI